MTENYEIAGSIRRSLLAIRDYYDEALIPAKLTSGVKLPTEAGKGTPMKYAGKVMEHSPAPADLGVIQARMDAHSDLSHYCRVILFEVTSIGGQTITTKLRPNDPINLVWFIDTWAERLVEQLPVEAAAAEKDLARHARALKGYALPERKDWITIGDCPMTVADAAGNSVQCGARVRAYGEKQFIQCPACGTEDTVEWWMSHIIGNPEAKPLVTASELISLVARDLGEVLTEPQIRQWASRNKIPRSGRDAKGRVLYDHTLVVALIREGRAA